MTGTVEQIVDGFPFDTVLKAMIKHGHCWHIPGWGLPRYPTIDEMKAKAMEVLDIASRGSGFCACAGFVCHRHDDGILSLEFRVSKGPKIQ